MRWKAVVAPLLLLLLAVGHAHAQCTLGQYAVRSSIPKLVPTTSSGVYPSYGYTSSIASNAFVVAMGSLSNGASVFTLTTNQQGQTWTASPTLGSGYSNVAVSADGKTVVVATLAPSATVYQQNSTGQWVAMNGSFAGMTATGTAYATYTNNVAISGDGRTIAVGSFLDNGGTGAVWMWVLSNRTWVQQGPKLVPRDASGSSYAGQSPALSYNGSVLAFGGTYDGSDSSTGAVWTFRRSAAGNWSQIGSKLVPPYAGTFRWGNSVSLSADGMTLAFTGTTVPYSGYPAIAVYNFTQGSWVVQAQLSPSGMVLLGGQIHTSVQLSANGSSLIYGYGSASTSYQGGGVWFFDLVAGQWGQRGSRISPSGTDNSAFGASVSMYGNGSTYYAVGSNGDSSNLGAVWIYGVYVYSCFSCPSGQYCPDGTAAVNCPQQYTTSPAASTSVSACTCVAQAGIYCPNSTVGLACPSGTTCVAGSTSLSNCTCVGQAGMYCPVSTSAPVSCPAGTTSLATATSIAGCRACVDPTACSLGGPCQCATACTDAWLPWSNCSCQVQSYGTQTRVRVNGMDALYGGACAVTDTRSCTASCACEFGYAGGDCNVYIGCPPGYTSDACSAAFGCSPGLAGRQCTVTLPETQTRLVPFTSPIYSELSYPPLTVTCTYNSDCNGGQCVDTYWTYYGFVGTTTQLACIGCADGYERVLSWYAYGTRTISSICTNCPPGQTGGNCELSGGDVTYLAIPSMPRTINNIIYPVQVCGITTPCTQSSARGNPYLVGGQYMPLAYGLYDVPVVPTSCASIPGCVNCVSTEAQLVFTRDSISYVPPGYVCCPWGYTGPECQSFVGCVAGCAHNGTCLSVDKNGLPVASEDTRCFGCAPGWQGVYCEQPSPPTYTLTNNTASISTSRRLLQSSNTSSFVYTRAAASRVSDFSGYIYQEPARVCDCGVSWSAIGPVTNGDFGHPLMEMGNYGTFPSNVVALSVVEYQVSTGQVKSVFSRKVNAPAEAQYQCYRDWMCGGYYYDSSTNMSALFHRTDITRTWQGVARTSGPLMSANMTGLGFNAATTTRYAIQRVLSSSGASCTDPTLDPVFYCNNYPAQCAAIVGEGGVGNVRLPANVTVTVDTIATLHFQAFGHIVRNSPNANCLLTTNYNEDETGCSDTLRYPKATYALAPGQILTADICGNSSRIDTSRVAFGPLQSNVTGTVINDSGDLMCRCYPPFTTTNTSTYQDCAYDLCGVYTGEGRINGTYANSPNRSAHFNKTDSTACACNGAWATDPSTCSGNGCNWCNVTLCQNGGTINSTDQTCECNQIFTGQYCEIGLCNATNSYAFNYSYGVTGSNVAEEIVCDCLPGWAGTYCDVPSCVHGDLDHDSQTCVCEPGYQGSRCEHFICAENQGYWVDEPYTTVVTSYQTVYSNVSSINGTTNTTFYITTSELVEVQTSVTFSGYCQCQLPWAGSTCEQDTCSSSNRITDQIPGWAGVQPFGVASYADNGTWFCSCNWPFKPLDTSTYGYAVDCQDYDCGYGYPNANASLVLEPADACTCNDTYGIGITTQDFECTGYSSDECPNVCGRATCFLSASDQASLGDYGLPLIGGQDCCLCPASVGYGLLGDCQSFCALYQPCTMTNTSSFLLNPDYNASATYDYDQPYILRVADNTTHEYTCACAANCYSTTSTSNDCSVCDTPALVNDTGQSNPSFGIQPVVSMASTSTSSSSLLSSNTVIAAISVAGGLVVLAAIAQLYAAYQAAQFGGLAASEQAPLVKPVATAGKPRSVMRRGGFVTVVSVSVTLLCMCTSASGADVVPFVYPQTQSWAGDYLYGTMKTGTGKVCTPLTNWPSWALYVSGGGSGCSTALSNTPSNGLYSVYFQHPSEVVHLSSSMLYPPTYTWCSTTSATLRTWTYGPDSSGAYIYTSSDASAPVALTVFPSAAGGVPWSMTLYGLRSEANYQNPNNPSVQYGTITLGTLPIAVSGQLAAVDNGYGPVRFAVTFSSQSGDYTVADATGSSKYAVQFGVDTCMSTSCSGNGQCVAMTMCHDSSFAAVSDQICTGASNSQWASKGGKQSTCSNGGSNGWVADIYYQDYTVTGCHCNNGYTGLKCDSTCPTNSTDGAYHPLCSGYGACTSNTPITDPSSHRTCLCSGGCQCQYGYTGDRCQTAVQTKGPGNFPNALSDWSVCCPLGSPDCSPIVSRVDATQVCTPTAPLTGDYTTSVCQNTAIWPAGFRESYHTNPVEKCGEHNNTDLTSTGTWVGSVGKGRCHITVPGKYLDQNNQPLSSDYRGFCWCNSPQGNIWDSGTGGTFYNPGRRGWYGTNCVQRTCTARAVAVAYPNPDGSINTQYTILNTASNPSDTQCSGHSHPYYSSISNNYNDSSLPCNDTVVGSTGAVSVQQETFSNINTEGRCFMCAYGWGLYSGYSPQNLSAVGYPTDNGLCGNKLYYTPDGAMCGGYGVAASGSNRVTLTGPAGTKLTGALYVSGCTCPVSYGLVQSTTNGDLCVRACGGQSQGNVVTANYTTVGGATYNGTIVIASSLSSAAQAAAACGGYSHGICRPINSNYGMYGAGLNSACACNLGWGGYNCSIKVDYLYVNNTLCGLNGTSALIIPTVPSGSPYPTPDEYWFATRVATLQGMDIVTSSAYSAYQCACKNDPATGKPIAGYASNNYSICVATCSAPELVNSTGGICSGHGACVDDPRSTTPYNARGKVCQCAPGWGGSNCATPILRDLAGAICGGSSQGYISYTDNTKLAQQCNCINGFQLVTNRTGSQFNGLCASNCPNLCMNQGSCNLDATTQNNMVCSCYIGFQGTNGLTSGFGVDCSVQLAAVYTTQSGTNIPCSGHGVPDPANTGFCLCDLNYVGVACETYIGNRGCSFGQSYLDTESVGIDVH